MKLKTRTTWKQKTAQEKVITIETVILILMSSVFVAYAAGQLYGAITGSINNPKGHIFSMDLSLPSPTEMVPGTEQSLSSLVVSNTSPTDAVYAFVEIRFDPNVYEITGVSRWEEVVNESGRIVYSYSSGGTMTEVGVGGSAAFSGKLVCSADNQTFQSMEDDDFVVDVTGYGIVTSICDSSKDTAWADYQNGGNQ